MRLLFAKPTYGPSADPIFDKSHRGAIMFAANCGIQWAGDVSPDRMLIASARNHIAKQAVEAGADGVFWVDSDIKLPVDAVVRLVKHNMHFVSGLYFQRSAPYWPVFARLNKKGMFEWATGYPENTLAPCDGVGFGCVYTSVQLLRDVLALRECRDEGPFGGDFGKRTYGEDFLFCLRARKAAYQPYVDTGVRCEHHIGPEFADEKLFQRFANIGGSNACTSDPQPHDGVGLHPPSDSGEDGLHS